MRAPGASGAIYSTNSNACMRPSRVATCSPRIQHLPPHIAQHLCGVVDVSPQGHPVNRTFCHGNWESVGTRAVLEAGETDVLV